MNENSVEDGQESKNKVLDNGKIVESVATEVFETESKILSLIGEVTKKYDEMVEIGQTVEHNKEIHELLSKVEKANMAFSNLRIHNKKNTKYFSEENYTNLHRLVEIIDKIREFIAEISKGYKAEIFRNLNNEFDTTVQLLKLDLEVPFSNYLPREVSKLHNEIDEIYKTAQYNRKTCEAMLERVKIADTAVNNLKIRNLEFFSKKNFINFRNLVTVIGEIRQFLAEISQLKGSYRKYVRAKDVQEKFSNLNDEFETAIRLLRFFLIIGFNARADDKKIKADIEGLVEISRYRVMSLPIALAEMLEINYIKECGIHYHNRTSRYEEQEKNGHLPMETNHKLKSQDGTIFLDSIERDQEIPPEPNSSLHHPPLSPEQKLAKKREKNRRRRQLKIARRKEEGRLRQQTTVIEAILQRQSATYSTNEYDTPQRTPSVKDVDEDLMADHTNDQDL
ncbi:22305_t:CDS:2 [Rhizophagus irregularis]|nr:22305_t:CDS:2 [Rhizophagus irregularis]